MTLDGQHIVPLEEFNRLYQTHYKIDSGALTLLLMKSEKRRIHRNGVRFFQKHWYFLHEAMLEFIGAEVEVRYSDGDHNSVYVILPNNQICEAVRLTPSSIISPNRETRKAIARARAHEKKLCEEFQFIAHSNLRGETTEDRMAYKLNADDVLFDREREREQTASIHLMTRMSRAVLRPVSDGSSVTASDVTDVEADISIFNLPGLSKIKEFDYEG